MEGVTGEPDALLLEDDTELVGVEMKGAGRIDEQAIEGGINGTAGIMEFNDLNHWKVESKIGWQLVWTGKYLNSRGIFGSRCTCTVRYDHLVLCFLCS